MSFRLTPSGPFFSASLLNKSSIQIVRFDSQCETAFAIHLAEQEVCHVHANGVGPRHHLERDSTEVLLLEASVSPVQSHGQVMTFRGV